MVIQYSPAKFLYTTHTNLDIKLHKFQFKIGFLWVKRDLLKLKKMNLTTVSHQASTGAHFNYTTFVNVLLAMHIDNKQF